MTGVGPNTLTLLPVTTSHLTLMLLGMVAQSLNDADSPASRARPVRDVMLVQSAVGVVRSSYWDTIPSTLPDTTAAV